MLALAPSTRSKDLASLSSTCRCWSGIAQEQLLTHPEFDIKEIHKYLLQLHSYPNLLPKVYAVEIRSSTAGRLHYEPYGYVDQVGRVYDSVGAPDALLSHEEFL